MSTVMQQIIDKYQGSAPQRIIHAVEKAAARTGADFALLMEKASTESGFNPSAKAKSSSATGLFQFIDSTWLSMVKEHGAKYGLGHLADKIDIKDGKPCCANSDIKNTILNLRKNPEISALMAGELTTENKEYLQAHTEGDVGATEMYLAHFMGANGAAKFLNTREDNGNAVAAKLFPREAHANKNVFFDAKTGHARTLNEIYDHFAKRFDGVNTTASKTYLAENTTTRTLPGSVPPAPASHAIDVPSYSMPMHSMLTQALPLSPGSLWNGVTPSSGFAGSHDDNSGFFPGPKLSAETMMVLAQMQGLYTAHPSEDKKRT